MAGATPPAQAVPVLPLSATQPEVGKVIFTVALESPLQSMP